MIKGFQKINENNIISVINGLFTSLIITLIFILLISFILVKTSVSERIITPSIWIITCLSIFLGSMKSIREKSTINGALVGIVYIGILYLISSLLNANFGLTINSILLIIASVFSGILGGLIGTNFKRI